MLDYYRTVGAREICHALKGDFGKKDQTSAVIKVAEYFLSEYKLGRNDVIIPAPQHTGTAEYTLKIAEYIKKYSPIQIADVLGRIPGQTLYSQKKNEQSKHVDIYKKGMLPVTGSYYFLDNVIDSGLTYQTAKNICGIDLNPMVYAVSW